VIAVFSGLAFSSGCSRKTSVATHGVDTISNNEMIVDPATPQGMKVEVAGIAGAEPLSNLEFTWRNNAAGSGPLKIKIRYPQPNSSAFFCNQSHS